MLHSNINDGGPDSLRRLHFPILEHPTQMPEQAPLRVREMFYDVAEQDQVAEPININLFWDDEENENDPGNAFHNDNEERNHIGNRYGREKMVLGIVGFFWIATVVLLGAVCGSGHCMSRPRNNDSENPTLSSPQITETSSPSFAPSSRQADEVTDNEISDGPQSNSSSNIFSRPTVFPMARPTIPTFMPPSAAPKSRPPSLFQNSTTENSTSEIQVVPNASSFPPTMSSTNTTTSMHNSTVTISIGSNSTNETSTFTLIPTFPPSNSTTSAPTSNVTLTVVTLSPASNTTANLSSSLSINKGGNN